MELDFKKNRAIKIIIIALAILAVLVILGLTSGKKEKELSEEEKILMSLTAPPGAAVEVPKEVIDSLTAKAKEKPVPEDTLKSLAVPK